ncbi:MAG: helix-turn-helix domain-containing protein [Phycisphaeraceae bacterium]
MSGKKEGNSVGDRIVSGLTELKSALVAKENIARKFTIRTVELDLEPLPFVPERVMKIRETMHMSQAVFAQIIGVSVHAVRAWEQGKREPNKMARRLLDEMEKDPSRWIELLNGAVTRKRERGTIEV